jgi:SAM-dependent methyltransferase
MYAAKDTFYDKEYWVNAADFFKQPYFRLRKCAKIVNKLASGKVCNLLDIGCGPATLAKLLQKNINYYGIDIAIQTPAENLVEADVTENKIAFGDKRFDIIVAAGLFEYLGGRQKEKFAEIQNLMKESGKFVVTYTNFGHIHPPLNHPNYNYVVPIREFMKDLNSFFTIERWFPSSHNWVQLEPSGKRKTVDNIQLNIFRNIPLISPFFTVNYFFVCSMGS